jgi:hypothetical protein
MLKPSFRNILLFLLIKYIVAYIVFMVTTNNYKMLEIGGIKDGSSLFYYLWMILFFPVLEMILFSLPFFLAFKIRNPIFFCLILGLISVLEYFVYIHFTSQKHVSIKGISLEVMGLVILCICFFRSIGVKFKARLT